MADEAPWMDSVIVLYSEMLEDNQSVRPIKSDESQWNRAWPTGPDKAEQSLRCLF